MADQSTVNGMLINAHMMKMLANFLKYYLLNRKDVLHEFKDLYAYSTQGSVDKSNIY